jgi:hypothetical protein
MENYHPKPWSDNNTNKNNILIPDINSLPVMNNRNLKRAQTTKDVYNILSVNHIDDVPLEEFATTRNRTIIMTDFPQIENEVNFKNNNSEYDVIIKATDDKTEKNEKNNHHRNLFINSSEKNILTSFYQNNNPYPSTDKISNSEMKELLEDINQYIKFDEENIKKSFSLIQDDYLNIQEFEIDQNMRTTFQNFLQKFDFKQDLPNLKKQIEKAHFDPQDIRSLKVGPVSSLDYLVEMSYNSDIKRKKSIIENLISLEDIIFRWRKIGGDGNCFYRAVIFGYLENIILERNIPLLEYFILDLHKKFNEEVYLIRKMATHDIKRDLVIKILVLLYYSLTLHKQESGYSKDIEKTYDLFIRCFNTCKTFDLGLIFYFRFKLYEFIHANENKLYTKDFSVKIGNLLPGEFETEEGNFLYQKFYEEYLMKLYKDAEKIVIYLTPFVLKINLQILIYDFGKNYLEKLKEFPVLLNPQEKPSVTLLYKGTHYDLIYRQIYFEKYVKYLTQYVNLMEDLKVINGKLLEEAKKIKSENLEKEGKILLERVQERGQDGGQNTEKNGANIFKKIENENLIDFNSTNSYSLGNKNISSSCIVNSKNSNDYSRSYMDINMLNMTNTKFIPKYSEETNSSNMSKGKDILKNSILDLDEINVNLNNNQKINSNSNLENFGKFNLSKSVRVAYPSLNEEKLFQHTQNTLNTQNTQNYQNTQNTQNYQNYQNTQNLRKIRKLRKIHKIGKIIIIHKIHKILNFIKNQPTINQSKNHK